MENEERYTKPLQLWMSEDMKLGIEAMAFINNTSQVEIVRRAVHVALGANSEKIKRLRELNLLKEEVRN